MKNQGPVPAGMSPALEGAMTVPWHAAEQDEQEMTWTELASQSRHDARHQLEKDVERSGAEGVVIATMQMRVRERDCPETVGRRDHIVEATFIGTAVARFSRAGQPHSGPALAVMSLDPQRRQAARVQI